MVNDQFYFMNSELLEVIENKLDGLIETNFLTGKYVAVFGMNHPGDFIIRRLRHKKIDVSVVIDNNPSNRGIIFENVPVTSPESALSVFNDNSAILICSRYYAEMRRQLEKMGYVNNAHIFKILDMGSGAEFSLDDATFAAKSETALKGAAFADKIMETCDVQSLLICPVKANGDVYMACAFLKAYLAKNRIEKYVLVLMGEACADVARMFGLNNNIYTADQEEIDGLTAAYRMLSDNKKINILQPSWNYSSAINKLDCYKEINFCDYYRHWVFGLDGSTIPEKPNAAGSEGYEYARRLFDKNGLIKGKTVILSHTASSLPALPEGLFEKLAAALNGRGFCVVTNVAGNETPVKGTLPLGFPISKIIPIAEYAGTYIGIRNGLCETLCTASCLKIIIYPQKAYGFGTAKDLFSVSGLSDLPVFELTYEGDDGKCVNRIMNYLPESSRDAMPCVSELAWRTDKVE